MSRASQAQEFAKVYRVELERRVRSHPEVYWYPVEEVPAVVDKMTLAFVAGTYNHDSVAIRATCKKMGIPYSRRGLESFFNAENANWNLRGSAARLGEDEVAVAKAV
jgi:3-dehydroquinate dehydratase